MGFHDAEIWRTLHGAAVLHRAAGKYVIAINDDIAPDNADAILWAMSYCANPNLDMHLLPHRDQGQGPRSKRNGGEDASVHRRRSFSIVPRGQLSKRLPCGQRGNSSHVG